MNFTPPHFRIANVPDRIGENARAREFGNDVVAPTIHEKKGERRWITVIAASSPFRRAQALSHELDLGSARHLVAAPMSCTIHDQVT